MDEGPRLALTPFKIQNGFADNLDACIEFFFCHDQRRREPNDVAVSGLGEQAVVFEGHAQVPRC